VEKNISEHAIRGVLSQKQERKWKSITFLSRMMQLVEINYKIYNKGLPVIVEALIKPTRCYREIQSLDRSWKSQTFQEITQAKWTTSKMISQVAGLWFYTT